MCDVVVIFSLANSPSPPLRNSVVRETWQQRGGFCGDPQIYRVSLLAFVKETYVSGSRTTRLVEDNLSICQSSSVAQGTTAGRHDGAKITTVIYQTSHLWFVITAQFRPHLDPTFWYS